MDKYLPKLEVKAESVSTAASYRFVFDEGWAIFTINDATGEFMVTSDWGNMSYRWTVGCQGKHEDGSNVTMHEFLREVGPDYVLGKCASEGVKFLDRVIDSKATRKEVIDAVRERNRETERLSEKIDDDFRLLDFDSTEGFAESINSLPLGPLRDLISWPGEYLKQEESPRWQIFSEALLPFFFGFLRKQAVVKP